MKKQNFFLAHKQFTLFFILALVIVGVAVFAPWVAPKDPLEAVMLDSLKAPCAEYPLGADKLGRDLLSRVIYGTRTSLVSTLILVATIFVVGTLLGIIAGSFPERRSSYLRLQVCSDQAFETELSPSLR